MNDKSKSFIGTKEWIGSFEVQLCMGHFLGVDCQILHVPTREDLISETTVSAL